MRIPRCVTPLLVALTVTSTVAGVDYGVQAAHPRTITTVLTPDVTDDAAAVHLDTAPAAFDTTAQDAATAAAPCKLPAKPSFTPTSKYKLWTGGTLNAPKIVKGKYQWTLPAIWGESYGAVARRNAKGICVRFTMSVARASNATIVVTTPIIAGWKNWSAELMTLPYQPSSGSCIGEWIESGSRARPEAADCHKTGIPWVVTHNNPAPTRAIVNGHVTLHYGVNLAANPVVVFEYTKNGVLQKPVVITKFGKDGAVDWPLPPGGVLRDSLVASTR